MLVVVPSVGVGGVLSDLAGSESAHTSRDGPVGVL